jgi:hypothetical protein
MSNISIAVRPLRSSSEAYHQFLNRLRWRRDVIIDSTRRAFKEAIRLGVPRADAYVEVAEKIWRAYTTVNWGVLNWQWKEATGEFNRQRDDSRPQRIPVQFPTLPQDPPQIKVRGSDEEQRQVNRHHFAPNTTYVRVGEAVDTTKQISNGHMNDRAGAVPRQRGGASLISYYV